MKLVKMDESLRHPVPSFRDSLIQRWNLILQTFRSVFRTTSWYHLFTNYGKDPANGLVDKAIEVPFILTKPYIPWRWSSSILMEFIGTFFIMFTAYLIVTGGYPIMGPLAIGSAISAIVYVGAHVSGAYYNPAVVWGMFLGGRQKISLAFCGLYVCSQVLACVVAALLGWSITEETFTPGPAAEFTTGQAFGVEILYMFILVYACLQLSTREVAGNGFYGLVAGFIVIFGIIAIGPISSGILNPAIATGFMVTAAIDRGGDELEYWWLYWVAAVIAAVGAAAIYRITNRREYEIPSSEAPATSPQATNTSVQEV